MDVYSIAVLLFAILALLTALGIIRRRNRKSWKELLTHEAEEERFQQIELIRVHNPTERDLQAYALIEAERQKVWKSLSTKTSISPGKIYQLVFELIREIARIYYPDSEHPEWQASVVDLLELNDRIIERVKTYLDEFPLNTIKDLNIQDILRYKGYYDRLSDLELV